MPTLINGFQGFDPVDFEDGVDRLAFLMNKQRILMSACEVENLAPDVAFLVTQLALVDEAMEALENFKDLSKPWKRNTEADIEHVKGEVIDQLFFVLQSCVALGMDSAEVFERYNQKHTENIQRIINKRKGMDTPL